MRLSGLKKPVIITNSINKTVLLKLYCYYSVIINVIKINWNQSLIVLPKYVGLIDCIDKSKNIKFTGLNTFYVGKQV